MQRDLTICKHWKNFKSGNPHQRLHKMLSKVKNLKQNIDFSIVWYMSWLGWSTFGLVCFSWHGIYLKLRKKILLLQAEQSHKMATVFTHTGPWWKNCHFCPIHIVTFTLISNLATDYIQKRRGEPGLFSFEYNLSPKLIST